LSRSEEDHEQATPKRQPASPPSALADRYASVRQASLALAAPLSAEDCQVQSMPDASPTEVASWRTSPGFSRPSSSSASSPGFRPFDPAFRVLFNSYYKGVGEQYPRPHRGLVTRPTLAEVKRFRAEVDERMLALIASRPGDAEIEALVTARPAARAAAPELLLTDIKHALSFNPVASGYARRWPISQVRPGPVRWFGHEGGLIELGHDPGQDGAFCFDNETPRHRAYAEPFEIASRPATYGEYPRLHRRWRLRPARALAVDGLGLGAGRPADGARSTGCATATAGSTTRSRARSRSTRIHPCATSATSRPTRSRAGPARGCRPSSNGAYGADTARAAQRQLRRSRRLPSDAADRSRSATNRCRCSATSGSGPRPPTCPIRAFARLEGLVGEYNGKFMCNQFVLRGGSCATPPGHIRASYRNFFPPDAQWQFSGVRLARDA
jgi:hypothetical protein